MLVARRHAETGIGRWKKAYGCIGWIVDDVEDVSETGESLERAKLACTIWEHSRNSADTKVFIPCG